MAKTQVQSQPAAAHSKKDVQPTESQIRLQQLLSSSGLSESAVKGKIKQIRDVVPTIKEDMAMQLLYDNQYDVERAIDAAFESAANAGEDEWVESKPKKGKKKERDDEPSQGRRDQTYGDSRGGRANGVSDSGRGGRGGRGGASRDASGRPPRSTGSTAPRFQKDGQQQYAPAAENDTPAWGQDTSIAAAWGSDSTPAGDSWAETPATTSSGWAGETPAVTTSSGWAETPAAPASGWSETPAKPSTSSWDAPTADTSSSNATSSWGAPAATTQPSQSGWGAPAPSASTQATTAPPAAAPAPAASSSAPATSWAKKLFDNTPKPQPKPAAPQAPAPQPRQMPAAPEAHAIIQHDTAEEESSMPPQDQTLSHVNSYDQYDQSFVAETVPDYGSASQAIANEQAESHAQVQAEPAPEPIMQEAPKPATPSAVKKTRAPAGEPVVMPRTASPLGDIQLGALGISFGMLSTEDKAAEDAESSAASNVAVSSGLSAQETEQMYQEGAQSDAAASGSAQSNAQPQQQQQTPQQQGGRWGKNRQGQQHTPQHHRAYGHHMGPMQPAMGHPGMTPGYPHGYGVEPDPMGMGYGYGHAGMPGYSGVPGWGYPAYGQDDTMTRSHMAPYYGDHAAAAYGPRAPGVARDRGAEKYAQSTAADPMTAQTAGSAHEPAAVQQPHAYMSPYHYGQYQYPMYPPYGQSYNVPPKFNAGYMYGQPPAAAQPPAKAQGQQGANPQAAASQYGQMYGQGYSGAKQGGYGGNYAQQQAPPAQGNVAQGAPSSSGFGGLQNRTASPSTAAPASEDVYKQQGGFEGQKAQYGGSQGNASAAADATQPGAYNYQALAGFGQQAPQGYMGAQRPYWS